MGNPGTMIWIISCLVLVSASATFAEELAPSDISPDDEWKGRWFPDKPTPAPKSMVFSENSMSLPKSSENMNSLSDKAMNHHQEMITMDNPFCDDGKQNLTRDVPNDDSHFICHSWKRFADPLYDLPPLLTQYTIPVGFVPSHRCMNETIKYTTPLPTFGPHRPVWAQWGEYDFIPPQRWIHNLEHGGIVMLYDPCVHHHLIQQLRNVVRQCTIKHIITPYKLGPERPLALVSWGWSLTMSVVDEQAAKEFIRTRVNHAPETIDKNGKYNLYLKFSAADFYQPGVCT